MNKFYGLRTVLFLLIVITVSSCGVNRKTIYFNDLPADERIVLNAATFKEPVIRPDDILTVDIQTVDPGASSTMSQGTPMQLVGASTTGSGQQTTGFLVDKTGVIAIPMFGEIEVAGLTTHEARNLILSKAKNLYKDPTVNVRFANYKITILGEVAKPGTYTVPNEKVTIFDALGLAGDLTIHGKRENVLLVRENNGHKEFVRFDLNSATVFESPYFYLRQNDLLYVEPGRGKSMSTEAPRLQFLSTIASFLSVISVLLIRL